MSALRSLWQGYAGDHSKLYRLEAGCRPTTIGPKVCAFLKILIHVRAWQTQ